MAEEADRDAGVQTGTPYDDVFRTMLNDCRQLIIPLINEVFGENYTGDEQVVFFPNEHYLNQQDGEEDKRVTDGSFSIIGAESRKYLLECQSNPDSSMLVRMFEYSTQVALDEGKVVGNTLEVEIPGCAILFLRSTGNTPDTMYIHFKFRDGFFTYDIPVIQMQRYSLEELLEKDLLFLLPFYIFTYDRKLKEYNANEEKLFALKAEFRMIADHLNELEYRGQISTYYKKTIIEMSEKVVDNLAAKYSNIKKEVRSVMGGKILEYEAKTLLRQGQQEGIQIGRQEGLQMGQQKGRLENLVQNVRSLMKTMGWTADQAMDMMLVSEEDRKAIASRFHA
ncbi:MAG: hypothetical protein LUE16_05090 [Lachnospiraceae bacterium]|nr:hypothetical protein [Lachnospiraceae bacterium]